MANFVLKHLRTVALASATVTSAYFLLPSPSITIDLPWLMTVKAAEYVNDLEMLIPTKNVDIFLRNENQRQ